MIYDHATQPLFRDLLFALAHQRDEQKGFAMDQDQLAPQVWLTRKSLAEALGARGLKISAATLATKATRGGGPPYTLFCGRALYVWADALTWAEAQLAPPCASTSEREAAGR